MRKLSGAVSGISDNTELSPKGKIIRAAERLFSENGIENTSLREIAVLSGNKNPNAVQYHFDSKEGLIRAIWQRHASQINQRRLMRMQTLGKNPSLRELVEAIVLPVAECLNDKEGGQHYLIIMSQLVSYGGQNLLQLFAASPEQELESLLDQMEPYLKELDKHDRIARMLTAAGMIFHGLSDYLRLKKEKAKEVALLDDDTMINNMVSMIVAAISAPAV